MFSDERRRIPRFPFHSKAELRLNFLAYRGELIDISLHGALFESRLFRLGVQGDKCSLEILQLNHDSLLMAAGVIVHATMNLIGIQFGALDDTCQQKIRQIASLNLAPPKFLNRKLPALFQAWQR